MPEHPANLNQDLNRSADAYLWQLGRVHAITKDQAQIKFDATTSCAKCLAGEGCGAGVFAKLFNHKGASLAVPCAPDLQVGQPVRVGVLPRDLLKGSWWLYGWPLAVFLITLVLGGALLGPKAAGLSEWLLLLLALGLGALAVRFGEALRTQKMNPIVVPWSCNQEHLE